MSRPPVVLAGPLAGHHLATLRDAATGPAAFRRAAAALSGLVVAEALRDLEGRPAEVATPLARARVELPARRVTLVPILRAGLVMLDPALALLPDDTRVGFIGMARDERTARARSYLSSLPGGLGDDEVVVLDVMIATGGSTAAALRAVRAAGARRVRVAGVIAAPEGLAAVAAADPDAAVTVAAVDSHLDERAFIVPGLGDAGDRLYSDAGAGG
ncbi:uracil phosphoribosyltransferase [Miltoncostaea marina]|uniref:uracil phosphoribosyltransferase n=1 Tax=Miltoncostaea marina TaxID=2843215 RepID=UPI001C3D94AB|nr:uracil phosphoribosyltransferase [Miltoncostaea marina]